MARPGHEAGAHIHGLQLWSWPWGPLCLSIQESHPTAVHSVNFRQVNPVLHVSADPGLGLTPHTAGAHAGLNYVIKEVRVNGTVNGATVPDLQGGQGWEPCFQETAWL